MKEMHLRCWHCDNKDVLKLTDSVDTNISLKDHRVLICRACGLIFKVKINQKKNINYTYYNQGNFKDFKFKDLVTRSKERAFVDINRSVEYINEIKKHVDLKKIKSSLDIGGAEGLFSNVIKESYENITTYCLEPDKMAIKVGKKLYPKVNFIPKKLEDLSSEDISNIDLITYWGGFYRSDNPYKSIKILKSVSNEKTFLFFSFPASLDDTRLQGNEICNSVSQILGKSMSMHLDRDYIKSFFKNNFQIIKYKQIQNFPFFKEIPLLIMKNTLSKKNVENFDNKQNTKKFWSKKFDSNVMFLKNYAKNKSLENFLKIKKKYKIKSVAIWCANNLESQIFIDICKSTNVNILNFISKSLLANQKRNKFNSMLSDIYKTKPDMLFITDVENQDLITSQLVKRIHLNKVLPIVKLYKNNNDVNSSIVLLNKVELNKIFDFEITL